MVLGTKLISGSVTLARGKSSEQDQVTKNRFSDKQSGNIYKYL